MAARTDTRISCLSWDHGFACMREQVGARALFLGNDRPARTVEPCSLNRREGLANMLGGELFVHGGDAMGPTKVVVRDTGLYDARNGKLVKDGFANRRELEDYVNHHYMALPVADNAGRPWALDGKPVYCLRGVQYETVNDERIHLARCPDCGGMGIRADEFTVESDCIRCTACGHEFDARLEMMEN